MTTLIYTSRMLRIVRQLNYMKTFETTKSITEKTMTNGSGSFCSNNEQYNPSNHDQPWFTVPFLGKGLTD